MDGSRIASPNHPITGTTHTNHATSWTAATCSPGAASHSCVVHEAGQIVEAQGAGTRLRGLGAAHLLVEPSIPSLRLAAWGVAAFRQLADSPKLTNVEVPLRSLNTAAVDALCIKALSLTAAGDAKGAAKLFGFADGIDDTQESLYLARGIHELAIGDVQRASDDFRKLAWMNGRSADAWWYLGELEDMAQAGRGRLAKKNAFRLDEMILFKTSVAKPGSRPQEWLRGQAAVGEGLFASLSGWLRGAGGTRRADRRQVRLPVLRGGR